jgi:hypothetical protein
MEGWEHADRGDFAGQGKPSANHPGDDQNLQLSTDPTWQRNAPKVPKVYMQTLLVGKKVARN